MAHRAAGVPNKLTLGNSPFGEDADAAGRELATIRHSRSGHAANR